MKTFSGYVELMIERLVLDQLLVVLSKEEGFEKTPNLLLLFRADVEDTTVDPCSEQERQSILDTSARLDSSMSSTGRIT